MSIFIVKYATTKELNVKMFDLNLVSLSSGKLIVDGNNPNNNDLILVKDQSNLKENGLYTVINNGSEFNSYILHRDMNSLYSPLNSIYYIKNGELNSNLSWCSYSDDEVFTCGESSLKFEPLGQYTKINNSLIGFGTSNNPLGVNIDNKSNNKIKNSINGLCVEHISDDSIIGEGSNNYPYKVLISEDTDNIISYGSDGGILARVNITNTTQIIETNFNGFSTNVSTNIYYNVRGQVITIEIDTIDGNSNSGLFNALGVIPLNFRPKFDLKKICYVLDNGIQKFGTIIFASNGDINIFVDTSSLFTESGVKRLDHFSCSYLI